MLGALGSTGSTGPTGGTGLTGASPYTEGTVGISGTAALNTPATFTVDTNVPKTLSIWGIDREPTALGSRTNPCVISQFYYSQGATNWDVTMTVTPTMGGTPQSVGYTIRYYYQ